MEWLFWALAVLVIYTYIGYGILTWIILIITQKIPHSYPGDTIKLPGISLVIPCYNEAGYLEEKIRNNKELVYPADKLEVVFITDGSDDNSEAILSTKKGIIHLHEPQRRGKASAMNRVVPHCSKEILLFSDANSMLNPKALLHLAWHYSDPLTGGVSGEKQILVKRKDGISSAGEGLYWKYESFLKKLDARLYSLAGAAGELMSCRKELYTPLEPDTILDDFVLSVRIVLRGYIIRYEPQAIAVERGSATIKDEFNRKVRISAGGWQAMFRTVAAFNPFRYGWFTYSYVSHRILRWTLAPLSLPILLLINIGMAGESTVYLVTLILQGVFYLFALLGLLCELLSVKISLFYVPFYFTMMNCAVYAGIIKFLTGRQSVTWKKARRN